MSLDEVVAPELWRGTAPGFRSRFNSFFARTFDSRLGSTRVQTFVGTWKERCDCQQKNKESLPLPPQGSTPRKELGSIPLLLRNKEPCMKTGQGCSPRVIQSSPPWRRRCSPRRPRESIPSQGRSSRQGNNPRWGPCGTPRILFSWAHFLPCL